MEKQAKYIAEKLSEHGYEAVFAGGWVRDKLIGVESHDIDIATDATPEQVQAIFDRSVPVGISFGVVRIIVDDIEFEVATYRKDSKSSDGRRPDSVEFCSMYEDAMRRDFTINGMYYSPKMLKVFDFVGGREDLKKGLIRFIGNPDERIEEDKLRMLRCVRFGARFGTIEKETLEAVKRHAHEIYTVSAERIHEELVKMLKVGKPTKVIELLFDTGLMHEILPEFEILRDTVQDKQWHPEGNVDRHTVMVMEALVGEPIELQLAGMFHDIGKPEVTEIEGERVSSKGHAKAGSKITREIMKRMKFSNDMIEAVAELVYDHMKMITVTEMKKSSQKRFFAQDNFDMLFKLHKADRMGGCNRTETVDAVNALLEEYSKESIKPKPFIDGRDIIDLGIKQGREIGRLKEMFYDMQLEGDFENREQAFEYARKFINESESFK